MLRFKQKNVPGFCKLICRVSFFLHIIVLITFDYIITYCLCNLHYQIKNKILDSVQAYCLKSKHKSDKTVLSNLCLALRQQAFTCPAPVFIAFL